MAVQFTYQPPKVNAAAALAAAAPLAVHTAAELLLAASEPLAPVDTGMLKASGKVTSIGGAGVHEAAVSYTAVAPNGYDYAVRQHEQLDYHHQQGQAKYLERPMHSEAAAVGAAMAATLRQALAL